MDAKKRKRLQAAGWRVGTAAEFLGLHVRTVRSRIEADLLPAWRDGKSYKIRLSALVRYKAAPPEARDDQTRTRGR